MTNQDVIALRVQDALWMLDPLARRIRNRFPVLEHDELVSVGFIALNKSAESFDPQLGKRFSTYGYLRVFGAMMDAVRKEIGFYSRVHWAGIQAITLLEDTGDVLRDDEAQHRMTAREVLSAVAAAVGAHMLSSYTGQQVTGDLDDQFDHASALEKLDRAFGLIAPEQHRLVEQHYMQSVTLRSIAEELALSYRSTQRLHNDAVHALGAAHRKLRIKDA